MFFSMVCWSINLINADFMLNPAIKFLMTVCVYVFVARNYKKNELAH